MNITLINRRINENKDNEAKHFLPSMIVKRIIHIVLKTQLSFDRSIKLQKQVLIIIKMS